MQLSIRARKAAAAALAASTLLWSAAGIVPQIASAAVHSEGCLVLSGGIVWMITGGTRRGYTSAEVFQSYGYNFSQVVTASAEDVALPVGPIMIYADGTLVKGPNDPLVYLVAGGQKRPFVSGSVFTGLGYSFANIQSAPVNTFSDLPTGANLDSTTIAHPAGTNVISNGAIWMMSASGRMGFPSAANFLSYGYKFSHVVAANSYDLASADLGVVAARPACTGGGGPTPPPPVSGTVNVASAGPASTTLIVDTDPNGDNLSQAVATLSSFSFAGSGTVTALSLARVGVSTDAMLANVYLFDGNTRITDAGSFSTNSVTFSNASGLFTIAGSKTINVKADLDDGTYSGQTVGVNLTAVTLTGGSVAGLPVNGPVHTVAGASLATVAIATPTSSGDTDPGTDITVWQSTWTVGVRSVNFSRLALRQIQNIVNSDVVNFRLYVDGTQVAQSQSLDTNGYVTFSGFSKVLNTGAPVVKVIADVIGGSSRNIHMSLRNKADVEVMDSQFNVNISVTGTIPAQPAADITLNEGSMTVIKATDSTSGNVTNNGSNQKLGKWTLTAFGEPIKIENLVVAIDITGENDADVELRNGKLFVNGSQVGSTGSLIAAGAATSARSFSTNFIVNPGTPATVELYSDIYDEDTTSAALDVDDTIQAFLIDNDVSNATRQVSLNSLDVPTGSDVQANVLTVKEGTMTLAALASYPNQTATAPQTAYKLGVWTLTGSSTEDINVTGFSLDIDSVVNATFSAADLTNLYVKYGGSQTSIKSTASATNNDWSVSFTLVKNSVVTIELYGNIGAAANITDLDSVKTDLTVTAVGALSNASATQSDIDGQTIVKNAGTFTTSVAGANPASMLVDDSGTVVVGAFQVAVTNDSYTLTEVDINLVSAIATSNIILKDGLTTLGTRPAATSNLFTGLNVFVAADTSKVLTVELQMSTINNSTGTGIDVTVTLDSVKHQATSSGVEATDTNNRSGSAIYAYKAYPAITNVTLPSSVLTIGTVTLSKFDMSSTGGTIGWGKLIFSVTKTADPTIATVASETDGSTASVWAGSTRVLGSITTAGLAGGAGTGTITFIPAAEEQLSGTKNYELRATIGGTTVDDSITTRILQPSSFATSLKAFKTNAASGLAYYDLAGAPTAVTAADVRAQATPQYTTAQVAATATVVGVLAAAELKSVASYGVPDTLVLTMIEGTTADTTGAVAFTVTGAGSAAFIAAGGTCAPYTDQAYTTAVVLNTTLWINIRSIRCLAGTSMDWKLTHSAALFAVDTGVDVSDGTLTLTVTKAADFAVGSAVAATDSDLTLVTVAGVAAAATFVWSDVSAAAHSFITADWTNGFQIRNLPTSSQTLIGT